MARSTKEDYTHQQDVEQLNQTLMSLKERYVDNRRANIPSENEAEFWAYRLILAPIYANTQLENELHHLPGELRHHPRVKTAVEIFRVLKSFLITPKEPFTLAQSNWKKFWDLIKSPRVSYLMACAAEISFNRMRHVVLDSIWRAYRVGNYKNKVTVDVWTVDKLTDVLGLDTDKEAVKFCEAFGFVFDVNEDGRTYLDIAQMGYANTTLKQPDHGPDFKPQIYSATIVEPKRYDRTLSSVISGISVQQARVQGLLVGAETHLHDEEEMEDETSLFIPETSGNNVNPFLQANVVAKPTGVNVFASPFQPLGSSAAATNPFLKPTSQNQAGPSTIAGSPAGVQSGLFDPSKNPIKFATSSTSSTLNNTTAPLLAAPVTPANPFLTGSSASGPSQTNPFAKFAVPKPDAPAATTTPQKAPTFTFPGLNPQAPLQSQNTPPPSFSFTPTAPPPQADPTAREAEQNRAEQERRDAAEKQRQQAEAQRAEAARKAREAHELEQRRKEAEAAELRRQQRLEEEQKRRAQEEQERSVRLARERQAQEEMARLKEFRGKEKALHSLTEDIMFHREEGLLVQFIENATLNIAQEAMYEIEKEKAEALGDELYRRYQMMLKRAGLAKILAHAEKKKRDHHVRERRRRIKEQRAKMAGMREEDNPVASTAVDADSTNQAPNGAPAVQRPAATRSGRRAKRTEERRGMHEQQTVNGTALRESAPRPQNMTQPAREAVSSSNGQNAALGYSLAYQQSTAPIDRTETDWFKLRALGIDPSKHRKRSFDSTSEEEDEPHVDAKRPKLSPPAAPQVTEVPKPASKTTTEDQLARFRAVQQAFKKSQSSPQQAVNDSTSVHGLSSLNGSSNDLIARARQAVATSPTPPPLFNGAASVYRASTISNFGQSLGRAGELIASTASNVQHDFGRSVPNLGFTTSTSLRPVFGQSGKGANADRPAYWQRTSRFVPRELYGKGLAAIREYRAKQHELKSPSVQTPPVATDSLNRSSPIPTQLSYMLPPEDDAQDYAFGEYNEEDEAEVVNVDAEDEVTEDEMVVEEEYGHSEGEESNTANLPYFTHRMPQTYAEEAEEDSEMHDAEDEGEDEEMSVQEYEEDGYAHAQYQQGYAEEVLQDYDAYTGDEDGDDEEDGEEAEEDTEEDTAKQAQPVRAAQPIQPTQAAQPAQRQPNQPASQQSGPGTTQDDAIELSD